MRYKIVAVFLAAFLAFPICVHAADELYPCLLHTDRFETYGQRLNISLIMFPIVFGRHA